MARSMPKKFGKGSCEKKEIAVGYGFTDYADINNIRKTAEGDYYIVDTEAKSFYDGNHLGFSSVPYINKSPLAERGITSTFCTYIRDRFAVLNNLDVEKGNYRFTFRHARIRDIQDSLFWV